MKANGRQLRLSAVALLGAIAVVTAGLLRFTDRAYGSNPIPTFFVTDSCTQAVTAYSAASNGDVAPLTPAPSALGQPRFVAFDKNGNIYVANNCNATVTIYSE